jgi:hypothetical protein
MKTIIPLTILSIILLCSLTSIHQSDDLCGLIKQNTPKIDHYTFKQTDTKNINYKTLFLINRATARKLFASEITTNDSSFFYQYFKINSKRLGLITYNLTYEDDHQIDNLTLHIIDSCSKVLFVKTISIQDSYLTLYELHSEINKDLNTLTIIEERSSEVAAENNQRNDTIFTDACKINLLSDNLDTISKTSKFELWTK